MQLANQASVALFDTTPLTVIALLFHLISTQFSLTTTADTGIANHMRLGGLLAVIHFLSSEAITQKPCRTSNQPQMEQSLLCFDLVDESNATKA